MERITRTSPSLVQPVSRVGDGTVHFTSDSLIVGADRLEKGITLPGLRDCKQRSVLPLETRDSTRIIVIVQS